MATKIITKFGVGTPPDSALAEGELGVSPSTGTLFVGDGTSTPVTLVDANAGTLVTFNAQTGTTYQLVLSDGVDTQVTMDNPAANTLTVPDNATVAFPVGTRIEVGSLGVGQTTLVAGGSTTIVSKDSLLALTGQNSGATLTKRGTDLWWLVGDLS